MKVTIYVGREDLKRIARTSLIAATATCLLGRGVSALRFRRSLSAYKRRLRREARHVSKPLE
ncbi:MAG: hypothetical protein Q4P72_04400 [Eubacteriales bacterium]|nr:hypothetical protein [Eubacteriales bacterium]